VHDYFVQSTFLIHLLRARKASPTFATVSAKSGNSLPKVRFPQVLTKHC
jgi:hypothetical protein